MSHTKEPWYSDDDVPERCAIVESNRNRAIAYFTEIDCKRENGEANRARAVACVNAMAGIKNPASVVAVLEAAKNAWENQGWENDNYIAPLERALAALAEEDKI